MTAPSTLHREAADLWIRWVSCLITTEEAGRHAKRLALSHDAMARETVVPILHEWWDACQEARDMLAWCARVAPARTSPERRRMVQLCCLCARTALPHAGEWRDEIDRLLSSVEAWARGEPVDLELARKRLQGISAIPSVAAAVASAAEAAAFAAVTGSVVDAAEAGRTVADSASIAVDEALVAVGADAYIGHLAAMADLIRAACPGVPL